MFLESDTDLVESIDDEFIRDLLSHFSSIKHCDWTLLLNCFLLLNFVGTLKLLY